LLDATGDVKSTALDNVPASDDASALTTGTLDNARLPSNISDTGTEGTKIASGTTAQRGSTAGQLRFNTDIGLAEYYTGTAFKAIDASPTVSSIDVTEVASDGGGNQTIVITGSGFNSGATVTFVGASGTDFDASTVTINNETQITAVAPKVSFLNAQEPYGVKVTNTSGLSSTLSSQINVDSSPSWSTASGNIGSVEEGASANLSVTATDSDGDTIVYSETTSVLSGAGFSLNSSTGAITGTAGAVSGDTTDTFTLRATANSKNVDRQFNIIRTEFAFDGSSSAKAFSNVSAGDSHVVSGNQYYVNTASGSPEQLYFYKFGNYAYALVALRYQSTSTQTNVNTNGALNSSSNNSTWMLGVTKTNYMIGQGSYGLIMVPQQASGVLAPSNTIKYGNLYRSSSSSRLIDTDIFTNNNAGEGTNGTSVRGVDLSTLGASSYPTNNWDDLDSNSHAGGNQILSYFSIGSTVSAGGTNPHGIRWSNANGSGYHDGTDAGNDVTGSGRNLDSSPPISLFLLVR